MTPTPLANLMSPAFRPSAETHRPRAFDDWTPTPADPDLDAVDRIVGRAALDPAYRALLLGDPRAALATEPMALGLKRVLIGIRAETLAAFAGMALEAKRSGQPVPYSHHDLRLPEETAPLPEIWSMAGVGS